MTSMGHQKSSNSVDPLMTAEGMVGAPTCFNMTLFSHAKTYILSYPPLIKASLILIKPFIFPSPYCCMKLVSKLFSSCLFSHPLALVSLCSQSKLLTLSRFHRLAYTAKTPIGLMTRFPAASALLSYKSGF
jgi:hypothetical protein